MSTTTETSRQSEPWRETVMVEKPHKSGTPGISFIEENPDVVYILLGLLATLVVYLWADRDRRRDKAFNTAIKGLADTLDDSLNKVVATVDRLDSKMEHTLTEAFRRIGSLETELSHLRGEHDTRKQMCVLAGWSNKND